MGVIEKVGQCECLNFLHMTLTPCEKGTADNASNNDSALKAVSQLMKKNGTSAWPFTPHQYQNSCALVRLERPSFFLIIPSNHVLNLAVRDFLTKLDELDEDDVDEFDLNTSWRSQSWRELEEFLDVESLMVMDKTDDSSPSAETQFAVESGNFSLMIVCSIY